MGSAGVICFKTLKRSWEYPLKGAIRLMKIKGRRVTLRMIRLALEPNNLKPTLMIQNFWAQKLKWSIRQRRHP